ncbi:MAG: hypothetical protein KKH98_04700 [Spirochaetes bacterium]|nr:hypothetical protein [Spirochaetota bacterium]
MKFIVRSSSITKEIPPFRDEVYNKNNRVEKERIEMDEINFLEKKDTTRSTVKQKEPGKKVNNKKGYGRRWDI